MKAHENFTEEEEAEYYRSLISSPLIKVEDEDAIEVSGWTIYIHENARASKVKGKMSLTPWQYRQLLRAILTADGDEVEDWSCVDLSGWIED
jgi:hypothetical protein